MENQSEYKTEDEAIRFGEVVQSLMVRAEEIKNSAPDATTARKWAIVRTDLEKVLAFVKYL